MERIDWSIINQDDWFSTQNMMFTYSEEEQEENKIAKNNADCVFKPKFIPVYTAMLSHFSLIEATIFGFIDFYLSNNERFYWSNEKIAEMLNISARSVTWAISHLEAEWLIKTKYRIKAWWGKIRFVEKQNDSNQTSKICYSNKKNMLDIYNNIINNNNKSKDLLLLNEEETKAKKEEDLLEWIADTDKKEIKQYWKPEINDLIWAIKEECDRLGVAYVKKKERNFSQLILTSNDYWELCDKLWMSRKEFAVNILRASVAINYFKWACSWPMRIYENYAEVYNLTKQKSDKNKLVEQNFTSLY